MPKFLLTNAPHVHPHTCTQYVFKLNITVHSTLILLLIQHFTNFIIGFEEIQHIKELTLIKAYIYFKSPIADGHGSWSVYEFLMRHIRWASEVIIVNIEQISKFNENVYETSENVYQIL